MEFRAWSRNLSYLKAENSPPLKEGTEGRLGGGRYVGRLTASVIGRLENSDNYYIN